jgi:DNA-binding transcriptional ArsR family regulator
MDDVAAAVADPVRREILLLLRGRVRSAGDIARRFAISRPAVSRHLRVLRESGLVIDEVRGRERLYRLDPTPLAPLLSFLGQLTPPHDRWSDALDALETEVYRTRRERRAAASNTRENKERSA